jgi:hypothetical protein
MTLSEYIGYSSIGLFIIYWITVNFFSKQPTQPKTARPPIKPYSFLKQSTEKMDLQEAKKIIDSK